VAIAPYRRKLTRIFLKACPRRTAAKYYPLGYAAFAATWLITGGIAYTGASQAYEVATNTAPPPPQNLTLKAGALTALWAANWAISIGSIAIAVTGRREIRRQRMKNAKAPILKSHLA